MARLIADSTDFSRYMRETEPSAKVQRASDFLADLHEAFEPRQRRPGARMTSTRLGNLLHFRTGEVTAWAGYSGHRKSTMLGQAVLDFCAQGERSLVISLEMPPVDTLTRMARQATARATPSRAQREAFAAWTDGRLWLFNHVGRIRPELCMAVCRYFGEEMQGRHVVIDSLMRVCESEEHLDEQKALMGDLCNAAQEYGLHVHLVAHCRKPGGHDGEARPPTKYDVRGSAAITDQAHNVVLVWSNKSKDEDAAKADIGGGARNEPDAMLIVDKQRNGPFEGKLKLWLDHASLRFCDDSISRVEPYTVSGFL